MLTIILFIFYLCQTTQENSNHLLIINTINDVESLFFGYQIAFDETCTIFINYKEQLTVLKNTKKRANLPTEATTNIIAKATWTEAVAQCRLRNFQIVKVNKSIKVPRLVTTLMLKAKQICQDAIYFNIKGKRNIIFQKSWEGHCVSHRVQVNLLKNSDSLNLYSGLADMKPVKTPTIALSQKSSIETEKEEEQVNVPLFYEDISNMKKFHTESYYTSSVSCETLQQVNFLLKETTVPAIKEITLKFYDAKIFTDTKNYNNERKYDVFNLNNINDFLNSVTQFFNQFTLPSLPQFGIRVVSAEDTSPKFQINNTFSQNSKSNESSKEQEFFVTEKLNQMNLNKTHDSSNLTNEYENFKTLKSSTTTEKIEIVSGGLYGENFDYDDVSSSSVIMENTEPTKFSKSNTNNVVGNITNELNITAILQRVIEEEVKLMNQENLINESSTSESFTNLYSETTSKPLENKEIPPYFAIESPMSVDLNENSDNFTPKLRILDETDEEKKEEKEAQIDKTSDFDVDSLKIDPYDKNSMLQLGRFLKSMFAHKTSNAQTINFNLISPQNSQQEILQSGQSVIEKNFIQRDTEREKENSTETISTSTIISTPVIHSTEIIPILLPIQLFSAPETFSEINKSDNEIKIKNNSTKNYQKTLFNIFKNLVNGIRIDINEAKLKSYVQRFIKEKLVSNFDKMSKSSWHKNFKIILYLLNGTIVRLHGERVQLFIASFDYKKTNSLETKNQIKSFDKKNLFTLNDDVKNKLNTQQRSTNEKEKNENFFRSYKTMKTKNKAVKKSINKENLFSMKNSIDKNFDFVRQKKIETSSAMVSIYFILKQPNDSIPILELHIRMPANSNPDKEFNPLAKASVEKLYNRNLLERKKKTSDILDGKENVNYKINDFMKNIISNMTSSRSISDLRRKEQLLFLALKYLKHISDERENKFPSVDENNNYYLNAKNNIENSNLKIPQIPNVLQSGIYPEMQNRHLTLDMIEKDLNSRTGIFNSFSNKRYDDMRRNLQLFINPRTGFTNYQQQELNRN